MTDMDLFKFPDSLRLAVLEDVIGLEDVDSGERSIAQRRSVPISRSQPSASSCRQYSSETKRGGFAEVHTVCGMPAVLRYAGVFEGRVVPPLRVDLVARLRP
jgi:hypothetical protein